MRSVEWFGCQWPRVTRKPPKTTLIAFRIFVVDKRRDFKIGEQVDHIKSQPYGRHIVPERGVVTTRDQF